VSVQVLRNCPSALVSHPAMAALLARRNVVVALLRKYCQDVLRLWAVGTGADRDGTHSSTMSSPQAVLSPTGNAPFLPTSPRQEPGVAPGRLPMYNLQQPILRLNPIQFAVDTDRVGDLRTTFDLFDRDGVCVHYTASFIQRRWACLQ
jgi:hypothetical protein